MNPIRTPGRTAWAPAAWGLAALGLVATPALADPPMGPGMHGAGMEAMDSGDMGMDHHGMGMHGGMGHEMRPHNAAAHFLMMADTLGLDDGQKDRLRKLRDDWIEANAANEARLKAAQEDLGNMLGADTIDLKPANAQLAIIGKVEGQLWQAFVGQLKTIKDLLTDDQRARLRDWHHRGPGMGMGFGMGPGMGSGMGPGMDPGMRGQGYDE
jgi:hypothetical protein